MPTDTITESIILDVELMKIIKDGHYLPHIRLTRAVDFVSEIINQLSPEDKALFEEENAD